MPKHPHSSKIERNPDKVEVSGSSPGEGTEES